VSLSWHEIASILIGLGGGYWLVSRIIERNAEPDWTPEDFGTQTKSGRADDAGTGRGDRSRTGSEDEPPQESSTAKRPWWEVLGVPQIATRNEIAAAYKRRISEYHPDKVANLGEEIRAVAERRSKEINAAYDEAMRRS
jgi:DnaJ like chaperone protein